MPLRFVRGGDECGAKADTDGKGLDNARAAAIRKYSAQPVCLSVCLRVAVCPCQLLRDALIKNTTKIN